MISSNCKQNPLLKRMLHGLRLSLATSMESDEAFGKRGCVAFSRKNLICSPQLYNSRLYSNDFGILQTTSRIFGTSLGLVGGNLAITMAWFYDFMTIDKMNLWAVEGHFFLNAVTPTHVGSHCEDTGCSSAFGGAGECIQLGSVSLGFLAQRFGASLLCAKQI